MELHIKNALISVYHKDNLDDIIKELDRLNVTIYSTGGTKEFIEGLNVSATAIEDLTSYPSILGGRVKTLHPKVFGGILARNENQEDQKQVAEYEIPLFDLVIVDLYPFEDTVDSGADHDEVIEKIDIGGISLIRAAAKNFKYTVVISSKVQYGGLLNLLKENDGISSMDFRKGLASKAFGVSSRYDTLIHNYLGTEDEEIIHLNGYGSNTLRYGENPHQKGKFHGDLNLIFDKLHGKELSYNNLLDIDAAINLISEFEETTFAVLKHNNACGIASRSTVLDSWKVALSGDPISAFGGVLICNRTIDFETSQEIAKIFFEVIIAPDFENDALDILKQKKNRIILKHKPDTLPQKQVRTILNGILEQDKDLKVDTIIDMKVVTEKQPTEAEMADLEFANKIVKHTKSNAIVLAKDQMLCASGTGQTSRVDALKQAIEKAKNFEKELSGAVMASDAFFPFPDCVEIAHDAGVTAVIQPGGSIKDQDSINVCNENNMSMVLTGTRHFRH
ncbi:MAG: bifunctional phosphoribosylaminoimidazolecarboxamide formyltransferase/IMP cyclohydrolase PurH [Bacteroidetes bacterium]|nr:bifunctional phosphoribosylaminoimidazolecarboxamide formyltransferase/IMP cyclohydrolase [Bacteroidia bacterium]PCH66372.1 MAG: bifunctional phosphoribosylaminoimidazolecarboxamide formyltransferase/IMP cyclohydrolase PurH [Bacteroidota bacterium]